MEKSKKNANERFEERPIKKAADDLYESSEREFEKAEESLKKGEIVKACVEQIPDGIAKGVCSLHANFGNKINDVWYYLIQQPIRALLKRMGLYR